MRSRLAANALLNVLAGASGALFAFAVPAMLAGRISAVDLSIWSVLMQTAVYVAPFTLGIQGVLARHVALHAERGDAAKFHQTMTAAFKVLGAASVIYIALGCGIALALGHIYPEIPADRLRVAQVAFALFLIGQASMIPISGVAGYFFGLQRNLAITANALGSKAIATILVVSLAARSDLMVLALAASAVTIAGNLWLFMAYRRSITQMFGTPPASPTGNWQSITRILRECAPISLWTFAAFLIYGGTTTIASTTDFARFPAYSMATAAALVFLGFHSASMNPLIPHIAVVHARGGPSAVGATLSRATLVSAAISATLLVAYAMLGSKAITALIPAGLAQVTTLLLPILLIGNGIRLLGLPYANTLVGLGMQGKILWTPVLEAVTTFGSALILAPRFGLPGIAASIAVGGTVSVLLHLFVNMPVTREFVPVRRLRMVIHSLIFLIPSLGLLIWLRPVDSF